jgi:hydroxymethylglutaryl-CoA lyase
MALPKKVALVEVGPREGFQFEGIGAPDRIATADKVRLVEMLSQTGLRTIQMASFVHPRQVPQMADAEQICAAVQQRPGVDYTGIYLNDVGLRRAIATDNLRITGLVILTASETFALRNQKRTLEQDYEMQRKMAALHAKSGYPVEEGWMMAAFGCNYEGAVPLARVMALVDSMHRLAEEAGSRLRTVNLADTMGWADPEQIRRTVASVRDRWPDLRIGLHLHDTRGLAIANVFAALLEGVELFDTAVGGLGGCPFAGHKGAAGNVCSEEVVFLCEQLGIETGVDLVRLIECGRFAERIVGHALPSKLLTASLRSQSTAMAAAS